MPEEDKEETYLETLQRPHQDGTDEEFDIIDKEDALMFGGAASQGQMTVPFPVFNPSSIDSSLAAAN